MDIHKIHKISERATYWDNVLRDLKYKKGLIENEITNAKSEIHKAEHALAQEMRKLSNV
jgi:hypothetical protein